LSSYNSNSCHSRYPLPASFAIAPAISLAGLPGDPQGFDADQGQLTHIIVSLITDSKPLDRKPATSVQMRRLVGVKTALSKTMVSQIQIDPLRN
jgi:hypothetical protein